MRWLIVLAAALALPAYAHAALIITKIMADPPGSNAGRQWIEISNTGTTSVDLGAKTIRLFTTSGNHLIKAYGTGGTVLSAGSVGVIAENPMSFLNDWTAYAGQLFKSSFTLPASGVVAVVDTDGTVLARSSYEVAPKPQAAKKSTIKGTTSRAASSTRTSKTKNLTTKSYGKGTSAPAAAADAAAAGATFTWPVLLLPLKPIFSTIWTYLALGTVAFSAFLLLVIQRQ
ncbi:MAG: lamin tail domain-containing protein [Candidatus Pacebacteria bacterium]|nr:lamin tail domain-containing protein [Candidatus Paceibacterota bacterium]